MDKFDVLRNGRKPCSKGREFFSTEVKPLKFSSGCQKLKDLPYNTWLFQLIEIYQCKSTFQNVAQVWNFVKRESEVWAICEDLEGNVLTFLGNDIFDSLANFNDVTLYVTEGKCLLKEECFGSFGVLRSA